jgi:pSer/pThr/pTyr-binding forkhead associated (FHA) protein/predicted Ser/Thr protein kinase
MPDEIGVGTTIGGYRVSGLIGQGGMGVVYLAEGAGGDEVALKVLLPEIAESEEFRSRFIRESRYANSLNHPNIVPVRDVGESDGVLYLATQYVLGTDLKMLLALEGRLEPERALSLLSQVASALDALHESGIFHRDVKPGNVIVASGEGPEEADHCYLTDFGLSKHPGQDSRALTGAGKFVGTYHYTAPEQILAQDLDHRVDVYSLGCVLYECLTGTPPFRHERETDVLHAHIEEEPPRPSEADAGIPEAMDGVIAKAMAKNRDARYQSCTEMIEAARAAAAPPAPIPTPVAGAAPSPAVPTPGSLRLKVTAGNAQGTEIVVEDELLIGRRASGQGKLADDIEISREHARISRSGGGYVIEDLGSTNGTFVNGRRISAPEFLAPGDRVELGTTTLVVMVSATPLPEEPAIEAAAAPPEAATPAEEPPAAAPPAAETPAESPATEALPPIPLKVEIDFGSREARLELEGEVAPVRLVFEDGRWQFRSIE